MKQKDRKPTYREDDKAQSEEFRRTARKYGAVYKTGVDDILGKLAKTPHEPRAKKKSND